MSKIGNYNLELQEVANDLGFNTVQEALDSGKYELVDGELKYIDEQTKAHKAWLEERGEVLSGLQAVSEFLATMYDASSLDAHWKRSYLQMQKCTGRAIEFIEEGEV